MTDENQESSGKDRDARGRFIKGHPAINRKGCRPKIKKITDLITVNSSKELIEKIVQGALNGDIGLLRGFQQIYFPKTSGSYIRLKNLQGDKPLEALVTALATGQVTDSQASNVAKVLSMARLEVQMQELTERLNQIEQGNGG